MNLVVADVAQSLQVLLYVLAALHMMLDVMQLQMSWIGRIPFIVRPATQPAFIPVAPEYASTNIVGNTAVMFRALPVGLQHVDPDAQIRAAGGLRRNRPTKLRA